MKLAFSVTFHRDLGTVETFLRMTFRPGHAFCLYVDSKASPAVHRVASEITECYKKHFGATSTIFKVDSPAEIYWGHISMVEADLHCLQELLYRDFEWKYFLNLPGSMLPAFGIEEMEDILDQGLKGGSFAVSYPSPQSEWKRFQYKHSLFYW